MLIFRLPFAHFIKLLLTIFPHDPDVHPVADLDVEGGLLLLHLVEESVCKMRCVTGSWQRRAWLPRGPSMTTS